MSSTKRRRPKPAKLPGKRPGPAGGKRDLNRRENLQRLCEAALRLFLSHGITAVTIDQIADAAGMAKGSFYRYARDKADLVAQIMAPVMTAVIAALERCEAALHHARRDTLAATYLQLAQDLALVVAGHGARVLLYLQEVRAPAGGARGAVHALADQLDDRAVRLTQIARDHALIRDVDPEIAALTVTGAIDTILFAHLRQRRSSAATVPAVIAELVAIVLQGVASPDDRPRTR